MIVVESIHRHPKCQNVTEAGVPTNQSAIFKHQCVGSRLREERNKTS